MGDAGKAVLIVALVLAAIGAINWGLVGLFEFDLVAAITGAGDFGETNALSRIIYVIVGAAGIISLAAIPVIASRRADALADTGTGRGAYAERDVPRKRDAA